MKSIYKFGLEITRIQQIALPAGSTILDIQIQRDIPCLWALVDIDAADKSAMKIAIYGTGNKLPDDPGRYISTFQSYDGALVFHAFEVVNETETIFKPGQKLIYASGGYTRAVEFVRMSQSGQRAKVRCIEEGWLNGTHSYVKITSLREQK